MTKNFTNTAITIWYFVVIKIHFYFVFPKQSNDNKVVVSDFNTFMLQSYHKGILFRIYIYIFFYVYIEFLILFFEI